MIPWFIVSAVEAIAWHLGYQTYVRAQGGAGWHRGRFGADRVYFIPRDPSAKHVPKLK